MDKLTSIAQSIITFINTTLVPLVFAIAFIVFIWGVFTYFIRGGDNPEKRQTGTQFIMYGLVGFFVMLSVWGLVNLLTGTLNLGSGGRPCLPTFGSDSNCSGSGTSGAKTTGTTPTPSPSTDPSQTTPPPGFIGPVP